MGKDKALGFLLTLAFLGHTAFFIRTWWDTAWGFIPSFIIFALWIGIWSAYVSRISLITLYQRHHIRIPRIALYSFLFGGLLSLLRNPSYATLLLPIRPQIILQSCMAQYYSNNLPLKPFSSVDMPGFRSYTFSKSSTNVQTFLLSYKARSSLHSTIRLSLPKGFPISGKSPALPQSRSQLPTIFGSSQS